jgi:hypothetical protein
MKPLDSCTPEFSQLALVGVPGKGPAVPQAPVNSTDFATFLSQLPPAEGTARLRVVIGPIAEALRPWSWAMTFLTTHWLASTTTNDFVTFQFDNVTAWAGDRWNSSKVQGVVQQAHASAATQTPWLCVDDTFPTSECYSQAAQSKWLENGEAATREVVLAHHGGKDKRPGWLAPVIATVTTAAVVSAFPLI